MALQVRLDTLIALNTALNTLESTQIKLTRAKNAANAAIVEEHTARDVVERATVAVSKINPATDPNYEDSLRKAQEDLLKKNKALEKILQTKDHEQAEIAALENQQKTQESIIENTKKTLGASDMVYDTLFLEISEVLNQQAIIKQNIVLAEAQIDPNEEGLNAAKKQAVLQELKENLEAENQKLAQLEKRLEAGESLFSVPKKMSAPTIQASQAVVEPILIPETGFAFIPTLKQVPAFYGQNGFRVYLTQTIAHMHTYIDFWDKTKKLLGAFIDIAWMSLLAPLETIMTLSIRKMVPPATHGIQWLKPMILLRALTGFLIGLILALLCLPFTTLGAVVALLTGIFIAFIGMISIWIAEGLMIVCMSLLMVLCSALKSVYFLLKKGFNTLRGKT